MADIIREAATSTKTGPGRIKLVLITPGQGSSGFYSPEVLEQAAKDKVWPRGTQSHINHDTAFERDDRPEGNLRNLAAVLLEDAHIENGELVAEARVSSAWRDFVEEFGEFIGTSISASAEVSEGEVDGRRGRIIERLIPGPFNRVDLVTVAGRGGRIAEVLESARTIVERGVVVEATANETRELLDNAIRAAHGGDDTYAWVRDYDAGTVWFERSGPDEMKVWQQAYTETNGSVTLDGEPIEVRARTTYTPITPTEESQSSLPNPAGSTKEKEGPTMGTTIEESRLAQLEEASGRVPVLEAENEKLVAENKTLREAAVKAEARAVVEAAFEGITAPKTVNRLAESYTLTDDGKLNADALRAEAEESAAEWKVANGAGTVSGVGHTAPESTEITTESAREQILAARGYTPKGAK